MRHIVTCVFICGGVNLDTFVPQLSYPGIFTCNCEGDENSRYPQYFTAAAHKAYVLIWHWVFLYLCKFILQLFYLIELTEPV